MNEEKTVELEEINPHQRFQHPLYEHDSLPHRFIACESKERENCKVPGFFSEVRFLLRPKWLH
ncbi:MAG: hypothetical protein COA78_33150 [Blastopirellula sp.]|nr:MAG: hypothetical protein COA78_33150 [Blastopirellula sp.]